MEESQISWLLTVILVTEINTALHVRTPGEFYLYNKYNVGKIMYF